MKRNIEIKFLYTFDTSSIAEPIIEKYEQGSSGNGGSSQLRWAIHLKKEGNQHRDRRDSSIWQWAKEGEDIRQSDIYSLFRDTEIKKNKPSNYINLDGVETEEVNDKVMPVIVQPSTDGWKNFVRQVHCAKLDNSQYEFTLVFNDEHLRKHGALESLYRTLRPLLYGRLTDLESFRLILEGNAASYFVFPGIYSGKNGITADSVHGDKEWFGRKAPKRKVKYHYSNRTHPIVFMNTANHAMAEEDNNGTLWKWEFVPWESDSPIVHGNKSRKQIEDLVRNLNERETVIRIADILRHENISDKMLREDQKLRKQYVDHIRREYIVNKTTAEKFLSEAISHLGS
jgi:hypothetical protein